jgi:hypothetical protein
VLVGLAGIFGAETLLATLALARALVARSNGKGYATSDDLLRFMDLLYMDIESDGLISVPCIRDKAKEAADRGVGWPSTLFALLDDIVARSARF